MSDPIESGIQRGLRDFARAYFIPANDLCGGVPEYMDRMAKNWGEAAAPYIAACVREDLRKAEAKSA